MLTNAQYSTLELDRKTTILFLASVQNQRSIQEEAQSSSEMMISRIVSPISIRGSMKFKGRICREIEAMKKGTFHIMKNSKNVA